MDTKMEMNLHTKLASLRKQKGLTQTDLAEKLNVSRQAISKWEGGAAVPSTENLRVLSDLYGVTVDYLLNDEAKQSVAPPDIEAPVPNERETKSILRDRRVIYIGVAIILVLVTVIISAAISSSQNQGQIVPIENMVIVEEDDYTTYTFSFE